MRKVLLTFIALWSWFSAFGQDAVWAADSEQRADASDGGGNVVVGLVRIKVSPEAPSLPEGRFPCGEPRTGNTHLDEVLVRIGAVGISRVFSDGGKFAERRRRYGLHLWYEIAISETVPVNDAIEALNKIDIIEYAVPVYRIRMSQDDSMDGEYDPGTVER